MALSNYRLTQIARMARLTHTELTDRHREILDFSFTYYEKNKVGPLYLTLKKHLGLAREELDRLFPHGLNSLYTWTGIPIQTTEETCKPPAQLNVPDFQEVYLDHNATTYLRHEVVEVLHDYHEGRLGFANPSSGTQPGQAAFNLVQQARETLAECLETSAEQVLFTSCGTEANNMVIKGLGLNALLRGQRPHFVCSTLEHASVLEPHHWLEELGAEVTWVKPDSQGRVSPHALFDALTERTVLVSLMAANNEIGTLEPVLDAAAILAPRKVPLLVDAVQALGKVPLYPERWGVTYMSFSAHKIYGPKGIGALYHAPGAPLFPLLSGGGQEAGWRSGTENVGYILAFAHSVRLACQEQEREQERLRSLRDEFLEGLRRIEPGLRVNGSLEHRLAGNLSIAFPRVDTGSLLLSLNNIGVYVSAGSACSTGKIQNSHVLEAIGADTDNFGTIRFSLGLRTRAENLAYVLKYLPEILRQIRD